MNFFATVGKKGVVLLEKPSLVLEGGTFRPIFSSGAMDALLDHDVTFPYCVGVSAGISDGVSYLSKQRGRNLEIVRRFRNDPRYIGVRNFFTCKSLFGLDFVFREIPQKWIPFDYETFRSYEGTCLVGVTNARTGKTEYFHGQEDGEQFQFLRATCAIPLFFPAIPIGEEWYYDGGLTDPIPVRKAIADGCKRHLIILTQPKGYEKRLGRENIFAAKRMHRRFPAIEQALLVRHLLYNETVAFCEKLEQEGKAVLLRPSHPLDSFEKSVLVLEQTWQEGYDAACTRMEEIRSLFQEPS